MVWLIVAVVCGVLLLMLLFGVALARASRNVAPVEDRTMALTRLKDVRSPSGKPFYPEENSIWELAENLEDVDPRGA